MSQEELLIQIHNQLVDLKKLLVEIELARPGTTHSFQTRLRQTMGNTQHIKTDGSAAEAPSTHQRVITPTNPDIQPGEGREDNEK